MSVRLLPLVAVLALTGCGAATARQGAVGTPFAGTWHQASATAANEPAGFLAIDSERVLFNLDGLPRGAVGISQNDTDPGLRSGRLMCADGRTLYLAVGDSLSSRDTAEGRLLTPTQHLDVQVFAVGATPNDPPLRTLRLWPSTALAVAAMPAAPVAGTPTPAAPAHTTSPADQHLTAAFARLQDPFLGSVAGRLCTAQADGLATEELDTLYRRCTLVVRSEVVHDLDAARRGDPRALARVDQRLDDLNEADRAYAVWRSRR